MTSGDFFACSSLESMIASMKHAMVTCPACLERRVHTEEEWKHHKYRTHGFTPEQGWTHPDLAKEALQSKQEKRNAGIPENKLRAEYGNNKHAIYGTMNKIGAMKGNKITAKGKRMERKHTSDVKMGKVR